MPAASTPRRNGPYAPLSAFYAEDDAVIALEQSGNDVAELLYLRALAYCAREPKLDGCVSRLKLTRIFNRPAAKLTKAALTLVEVGLWESTDGGWRIRRWDKWNASAEEIAARRKRDSDRKGFRAESAPNPVGTSAESATHIHSSSTAVHDTAQDGSGSLAPPLLELQQALGQNGIRVSFDTDPQTLAVIADAVTRCGVSELVKHAKARHQPNNPAFSIRAYVAAFAALPARTVKLEAVTDPCPHGVAHWTRCADCKAAAEAS